MKRRGDISVCENRFGGFNSRPIYEQFGAVGRGAWRARRVAGAVGRGEGRGMCGGVRVWGVWHVARGGRGVWWGGDVRGRGGRAMCEWRGGVRVWGVWRGPQVRTAAMQVCA